ncbi:MAG: response regulator transcription factor [Hydrococcus sp. C42_A2020_068]|uniref:response regulator transcription factor n=1 Tax=Pleurocapsa sp. PCC 7327 TaxID=118163 RepID=UPI00029FA12E|nr:response regulator transcription factor [Pleurocapsa sp. PCC 7327]AFY77274.1 response regulator with CheY-like receiver domain and winged-helix DNA-binding domain [Pleurocapsa sp. PCC 7327]MBF2022717.1 response regulator transcription factor [Hydrococcus sp. C42_A2020_068]
MNRILIAEDEPRIVAFIEKGLRANGFTTLVATNADEVISMALGNNFDLLLLDLGLPGKDGLSVLEELCGQGATIPIIILTARDDINDKLAGLEGGADDYMTKPFRFEELLARIRLRLRSQQRVAIKEEMELRVGEVMLNLRTRQVRVTGKDVELSAREFTLLETLLRHQGQVMSREQLLDRVWGYDYDPGSNIVDVYVGYLRKKLGSDLIETVRGMGYRLRG